MRKIFLLCLLSVLCLPAMTVRADTPDEQIAAASALFDAQKYAEAAQKLDAFLAATPKHPKAGLVAFTLARCRVELKQYPQAIAAYEKAIATKDSSVTAVATLGLGEAAFYGKQYEKAADALESAIKSSLSPEQAPVAWYWLAQSDMQLKRYGPAEEAYSRIIRTYPRSNVVDSAYFGLGLAELRQNKKEDAKQAFRTLSSRYPRSEDRPQAILLTAQIDLEAKRYDEARVEFESLLKNFASTPAGQRVQAAAEDGLIQVLLELKEYNAASGRLEDAIGRLKADDPQRFRANLSLGHCRYRQKQYDLAYAAYMEAAKSTETGVASEGLYWAGNAALGDKKPSDAAVQFSKFVTKYPKSDLASKAQLKAGDAYLNAKQNDSASIAYRAVVDRYPQSAEATEAKKALSELVDTITDPAKLLVALKTAPPAERARGMLRVAKLYIQAKKENEALLPLTDLLKTKPEPDVAAEANYLLGSIYEAQDKSALAAPALAEAVRLTPGAAWAGDAQGRLAWLYLELKQPASAERAANAALAAKPEAQAEEQARLALVQALLDQKKWDAALEGCKTLMSNNPAPETLATVLYTQAWVSEKQNKPEEALPLWEKLAADYPKSPNAAQALVILGNARLKEMKYEEARVKYAQLLMDFPKSAFAAEARFNMGSTLFNLDRPADAATEFDTVAADKTAGDYIPEALYWGGVALDKADKKSEAIKRLTKLVDQYPKSPRVANAKIRLAALKAVAGNGN